MNYDEALSFIHSVEWRGSRPGLSRITELLALLGNPERDFRAIHIAGTNGKGSFCSMLESVLRSAGYRTGLFTSPYLEFFEERICLNGFPIEKHELAEIVTYISGFCRKMTDHPTEFELLTAIGFEYFKRKKVDIAVIECGMGGRLDSTNVLPAPLLSVITGISLDHMAFLGNTVSAIAKEKAGIIKPGCPILFGGNNLEAETVIRETAERLGSPYIKKDGAQLSDIRYSLEGTTFNYRDIKNIRIPLLGAYQPENAATVIEAVTLLKKQGFVIPETSLKEGLSTVRWKGRFEILHHSPLVIFDGGHNEEGVAAAVKSVKLCLNDRRLVVISGVMKDKDYKKISREISDIADKVFTVTPNNPRAMDSVEYANEFNAIGTKAFPCQDFDEAVRLAYQTALRENRPLLCVGSLYSYSSFKTALQNLRNC